MKCVFINEREVTQDFRLAPGDYVIVPSTADPEQECEFILRVFSRKHTLYAHGDQVLCQKEISDKQDEKIWENFFVDFFQNHPEINVGQLQTLLNKKNWSNSRQTPVKFSLDGCKVIMAQLDLDTSGTLSLQEFRSLWKRTITYQEMFQKRDTNKSGYINLNDLQAIAETKGIKLSNRFSNLMATRYGDSSLKLTFENFVCFMLRLEINGEVFHNLSRDGKGIYLQEAEWMMLTLYS
ncbi:hypothetical protein NDU88_010647 [Pleurodeles waltl]|uniref:EF-hand domain-containing protein n=1 Tax=Pleurodeles waltl TaxID=8319 RepID=A0AAV7S190_PLEWA|nr:hypothetical protein NDU88_010647 [Pleurodeles waltl]